MYRILILLIPIVLLKVCTSFGGTKQNTERKTYTIENDTIVQQVDIEFISESKILFSLTVKNKIRKLTFSLSDTAEILVDENYKTVEDNIDIDFDEIEQLPFRVIRYFFKKNCDYLTINIEENLKKRVSVGGTDTCNNLFSSFCPLMSIGTMREKSVK